MSAGYDLIIQIMIEHFEIIKTIIVAFTRKKKQKKKQMAEANVIVRIKEICNNKVWI